MATCWAPALMPLAWPFALPPRRRFSSASMPPWLLPSMEKRPRRVSLTISPAEMQPTMASQWSRRACRSGSTAWICSSTKSMQAITMSPPAMSALQRFRDCGSLAQSVAA